METIKTDKENDEIKKRNLKKIGDYEREIIRYKNKLTDNNLTAEQIFFIKYAGLTIEDIQKKGIDVKNREEILKQESELLKDELETARYNAMIEMLFSFPGDAIGFSNKSKDRFHEEISSNMEYTKSIDGDTLLIKRMRNLQLLNKLAHLFRVFIMKTTVRMIPNYLHEYDREQRRKIQSDIEMIILPQEQQEEETSERVKTETTETEEVKATIEEAKVKVAMPEEATMTTPEVVAAEKRLEAVIDKKIVKKIKNNRAIKMYLDLSEWMYKQKTEYTITVLNDLMNTDEKYHYGKKLDEEHRVVYIFDVPGYGQFSVHRKIGEERLDAIEKKVPQYDGEFLKMQNLLYKADEKLIKEANFDELSDREKSIYKIVTQTVTRDKTKATNLIKWAKDKEKARKIVKKIEDAGLNPTEFVTNSLLENGVPEEIGETIKLFLNEDIGIDIQVLKKCKKMLEIDQNKRNDIIQIAGTIKKLKISSDIFEEVPEFLIKAKPEEIEPVYEILKQYNILLTNKNIATAFLGSADNIRKNIDWAIENGAYDVAQSGYLPLFELDNSQVNMIANVLLQNEESLITGKEKRTLNNIFMCNEKKILKKYDITEEETIEELSKIRGQELLKGSKYNTESESSEKVSSKEQQQVFEKLFRRLEQYQSEDGIVIKIGSYCYSAHKVKEQLNQIVTTLGIESFENENIAEILKMALLKNKNIDKKEVEYISQCLEANRQAEILENNKEKYDETRSTASDIKTRKQELDDIKLTIEDLKEQRDNLKRQIKENEEKMMKILAENEQPTEEVIQSIKELQRIIERQKSERAEIKKLKKNYKEEKNNVKKTIKDEEGRLKNKIDGLEL